MINTFRYLEHERSLLGIEFFAIDTFDILISITRQRLVLVQSTSTFNLESMYLQRRYKVTLAIFYTEHISMREMSEDSFPVKFIFHEVHCGNCVE